MRATATFAAGCFWHAEEAFRTLPGVISTRVGYMGGQVSNPTDADLRSGRSGHAEVVEVIFDPAQIAYERLLEVFWRIHDPTVSNLGGLERSALFFHDAQQESAAHQSKQARSGTYENAVVTEIVPAAAFYSAPEHHQQYYAKHGPAPCEKK